MPTRSLADVIPDDEDTPSTTATEEQPAASSEPATDTTKAARKARGTSTRSSSTGAARKSSARSKAASAPAVDTGTEDAATSAGTAEPAAPPEDSRATRPRVPKAGPITRVTVDLAVSEQTAIEQLTSRIGREVGRAQGKARLHPQHLMRVAVRRLLTDDAFRRAVTEDLRENRDQLKRPQR